MHNACVVCKKEATQFWSAHNEQCMCGVHKASYTIVECTQCTMHVWCAQKKLHNCGVHTMNNACVVCT
jgi:hypothetical protein